MKLNYIEQINLLHRIRRKDSLDTVAVAMYSILLDICNRDDWENPFMLKNDLIQSDLGVTFKTMAAARNKLQQSGLIKFKSKAGSAHCNYELLTPAQSTCARTSVKIPKVGDEVRGEVVDEVTAEVPKNTNVLYKPKLKPKTERVIHPRPETIFDLDYFLKIGFEFPAGSELTAALDGFLKYRQQHPIHGPVHSGHQVEAIMGGFIARSISETDAVKCIQNTIEKGAKNIIYDLPKKNENGKLTKAKGHNISGISDEADRILREYQNQHYNPSGDG